jgi:hypothetical protein
MNRDTLKTAIAEAERFLKRAKAIPAPVKRVRTWDSSGEKFLDESINPKDSGAVRRSSMDLTRALADLRRPS